MDDNIHNQKQSAKNCPILLIQLEKEECQNRALHPHRRGRFAIASVAIPASLVLCAAVVMTPRQATAEYIIVNPALGAGWTVTGSGSTRRCNPNDGTPAFRCPDPDELVGANSVGSSEISDNAVGASELANNSVDAGAIQTGAVGASEIADGSVGAAEIGGSAVGSSELADDAVDTAAIQDGAVTSAKIANGTVEVEDLSTGTVDEIDRRDQATLKSANQHADEGDVRTLAFSKRYTDEVGEETYQRSKAYTDQQVEDLRYDMNALGGTLSDGIAIALSAKVPTLANGHDNAINVGLGNYNGSTALSIGGALRLDTNVVAYGTLGVASRTRKTGTSLGVMWSW